MTVGRQILADEQLGARTKRATAGPSSCTAAMPPSARPGVREDHTHDGKAAVRRLNVPSGSGHVASSTAAKATRPTGQRCPKSRYNPPTTPIETASVVAPLAAAAAVPTSAALTVRASSTTRRLLDPQRRHATYMEPPRASTATTASATTKNTAASGGDPPSGGVGDTGATAYSISPGSHNRRGPLRRTIASVDPAPDLSDASSDQTSGTPRSAQPAGLQVRSRGGRATRGGASAVQVPPSHHAASLPVHDEDVHRGNTPNSSIRSCHPVLWGAVRRPDRRRAEPFALSETSVYSVLHPPAAQVVSR